MIYTPLGVIGARENQNVCIADAYNEGAMGCLVLAKTIEKLCIMPNNFKFTYNLNDSIKTKIEKIATKVYGAKNVCYSDLAQDKLKLANKFGFNNFYVNIAKTQFSFSDNKELIGAPKDFTFHITDIEIRSGAKMIVAIAGNILLMPGLGKNSNYLSMNINKDGNIEGLF